MNVRIMFTSHSSTKKMSVLLLRLALVPLGHLLARLPLGNIGRSHVSAFRTMVPAAEVTVLMDQALEETAIRPVQPGDHGV